jgi:hypothetical protein
MTIQGILSAFCVAAGAAAFDRVLGANSPSALVTHLQSISYPYLLAAITSLMTAALFFYTQRGDLAWLHGVISLAVTREMRGLPTPPDTHSFIEGLDIGNSWSLWCPYKFGMSCLAVTALEVFIALFFAISLVNLYWARWLIAGIPFVAVSVFDYWFVLIELNRRDEQAPEAANGRVRSIRAAKRRRRLSTTTSKRSKQSARD